MKKYSLIVLRLLCIDALNVNENCSEPLGMQSGVIQDQQISASSSKSTKFSPQQVLQTILYYFVKKYFLFLKARLNGNDEGGAWCPDNRENENNFLEIDLINDYVVSGVTLQGRNLNGGEYASHFRLQFWRMGFTDFADYRHSSGEILLSGNINAFDTTEQDLSEMVVIASKIR